MVGGLPDLKIQTWATHHLWSDMGHPSSTEFLGKDAAPEYPLKLTSFSHSTTNSWSFGSGSNASFNRSIVAHNMSSCSETLPSFLFSTALRIWSRVTITPGSGTRNLTFAVRIRPPKSKSNIPAKTSRMSLIPTSKSTKCLRNSICSNERDGSSEFWVKLNNLSFSD
jgi:hypothetical protein